MPRGIYSTFNDLILKNILTKYTVYVMKRASENKDELFTGERSNAK